MDLSSIISFVLSAITAFTAIAAIVISIVQISKSNKQSLFDRRLKAYLTIKWMKSLCDHNQSALPSVLNEAKNGPIQTLDLVFVWMTNDAFLEEVQPVITNCLDNELQRKFLIKIEDLRNLCEEVRMVFPESVSERLADFIYSYEEMLMAIYRYQICLNHLLDWSEKTKRPLPENDGNEMKMRAIVVKYLTDTFGFSKLLDKESSLLKAKKKIRL